MTKAGGVGGDARLSYKGRLAVPPDDRPGIHPAAALPNIWGGIGWIPGRVDARSGAFPVRWIPGRLDPGSGGPPVGWICCSLNLNSKPQ